MAIRQLDRKRIEKFCEKLNHPAYFNEMYFEVDFHGHRYADLMEVEPPFPGVTPGDRFPLARLRYTSTTDLWELYWVDSNDRFHRYPDTPATPHVQTLLDFLAGRTDPIFFG
ncbi:hypothetical protein CCICO_06320 [Corynebacterium ciconiae DSM 44920]|uniref:DUF3024 domain-containing protein n=1 Tax=Corynebacterium ciconiae TaxID=227319 RepID=UPI0003A2FC34|nr:DUF3024 domain-containing protein [Corynebacterium ciconiae]WKD61291.1 hypothetical protein CCICO_06320 [Corynebacterium ciconiae DSM 44920]